MAWSAILVGADRSALPAVQGQLEAVEASALQAPLVLLAAGLPDAVIAAARRRWPDAWLAPLVGSGPAAPDAMVMDLQAAAGRAAVLLDADGAVQAETAAATELLDAGASLSQTAPGQLIAPSEAPDQAPDLGNRLRRLGGTAAVALTAHRLGEGAQARFVVELQDCTELLRARQAERRTEAWNRSLLENAQDAVAVLDAHGNVSLHSPGSLAHLGAPHDTLVGSRFEPPFAEDRERASRAFKAVRSRPGAVERVVWRVRHPDGSVRWLDSVLTNRLDDPAVQGIVVHTRDVTEQRKLEGRLREAERLQVAELLAATVAHDLNNMIGVVLVGLDQLQATLGPDPATSDRLATMTATMERASELARRLAAFGKGRSSQVRRLDLGRVVGELTPLLRTIVRKGQVLEIEIAEGTHPVRLDRSHLDQALVNLVVNARDALQGRGGTVRVVVERRPGGERPEVAVVVQDDGIGMDAEVQARLGQPFFTTKGPDAGTGLGMVVVQGFAHDAGGRMEIESAPGRGSRIGIVLPIDLDASDFVGPGYPRSS